MNVRILNINALLSCLSFLVGNITYDWMTTPTHEADYRIFYIPLSYMVFSLVLLGKDYAKKQGGKIYVFWWSFWWLSIAWVIKFLLFYPYLQMLSDYGFLGMVIIGTVYKLYNVKVKK